MEKEIQNSDVLESKESILNKITIGLVEDQLLFRQGIKAILSTWSVFEVIFESADGYSVIQKLNECSILPDVLLIDLSLPPNGKEEYSGLHLTKDLRELFPDIKIIVLSAHENENFIIQLIENGAHSYLVKDSDPEEVYDAITNVVVKGSYINERSLKAIQNNLGKKTVPQTIGGNATTVLTKREIEILDLICQEKTTDEIAEILFISPKTVNGHRNNLLQKTGARNVAGLVVYAMKNI